MGDSGTSFPLRDEVTKVGRATDALRLSADDTLPAVAASFTYRDGRIFVRDEGGASGVFVRLAAPAILGESDDFSLGDKLLRFLGKVPPTPPTTSGSTRLLGSARTGNGPLLRLQVMHLGGIPGRIFARPAPLRIGRALGEILFPDDPFVSARHCEIDLDPAGAILRDLGSSNGTFLRLPRGGERELRAGDTIRLGRNVFRVE